MDLARQPPLSMEFSRQEYWSGLPFPSPGYFPDPESKPGVPSLQADSLPFEPPDKPILHSSVVLVTQLCLTPCDPMDYSPPGSFVHGILQARILEWAAMPF